MGIVQVKAKRQSQSAVCACRNRRLAALTAPSGYGNQVPVPPPQTLFISGQNILLYPTLRLFFLFGRQSAALGRDLRHAVHRYCHYRRGLSGSTAAAMLGRAGISTVLIDPHEVYPADFASKNSAVRWRSSDSRRPESQNRCCVARLLPARSGSRDSVTCATGRRAGSSTSSTIPWSTQFAIRFLRMSSASAPRPCRSRRVRSGRRSCSPTARRSRPA